MKARVQPADLESPVAARAGGGTDSFRLFSSVPPYAFLLPISPVFLVYAVNLDRIAPSALIQAAGWFVVSFVAILFALRAIFKRPEATDPALASLFVGAFLSLLFQQVNPYAWMLIWTAIAVAVCRFQPLRSSVSLFVNTVAAALVVWGIYGGLNGPTIWNRSQLSAAVDNSFPEIPAPAPMAIANRDIYYIVLDRYARADQLKELYGFDNSNFLNSLKARGFVIADNAYSNYQRTAHSLSSSLNMDYLDGIGGSGREPASDWLPIYQRLSRSRLVDFLTRQGFAFHFFGSWWEPTRTNPFSDVTVNYRAWPELLRVVLENSIGGNVASWLQLQSVNPRQLQCVRARKKFAALAQLPARHDPKTPKFVFAHFLVPHPPFVIDGEGNCLGADTVFKRSREQNYVEQVKYANSQIQRFLDQVRVAKGPKPIIVVQADEGPWPKRYVRDEIFRLGADVSNVNWLESSPAELREKMAILNALYLPDTVVSEISPNASPVNNFRIILRRYFGVDLADLANKSYIYPNRGDLYRFHDVTAKLRTQ